jgi:hypothetical protein
MGLTLVGPRRDAIGDDKRALIAISDHQLAADPTCSAIRHERRRRRITPDPGATP